MAYGKLEKVENLDRKGTANTVYWRVMVKGGYGIETLVLTDTELVRVRARAASNPEDTQMVPTWWDRATAAFSDVF
jgi:hypothetical protein